MVIMNYILTPGISLGTINLSKCKYFQTVEDIQEFLKSIDRKWGDFVMCPEVYQIFDNGDIKKIDDSYFYKQYIYPYTYHSRSRNK